MVGPVLRPLRWVIRPGIGFLARESAPGRRHDVTALRRVPSLRLVLVLALWSLVALPLAAWGYT